MSMTDEVPAHLRGNGAPVHNERTLTDLRVTGTIPSELDGRYVRNGANPITGMSDHPFFGDGMIHGVRLRDGSAEWYRNRYVKTPFFTDPQRNIQIGCWYLEKMREKYRGSPAERAMMLAAYNAGASRVEEWTKDADKAKFTEAEWC